VIPPRQKSVFARFPMRCPVESLHLPHMMRSRTKPFLYTGVCLVYCSGGAVSLVSPNGAPPSRGFCTSEPEDGSRSGGGGLGAGGHTSRAGSSLPRPTTSPCGAPHMLPTRLTASTCQGPSTFFSIAPLRQGDSHVYRPGRFRTVSLCAVSQAPCRANTTGAVFWRALSELLRELVCECPILASGIWQPDRPLSPQWVVLVWRPQTWSANHST